MDSEQKIIENKKYAKLTQTQIKLLNIVLSVLPLIDDLLLIVVTYVNSREFENFRGNFIGRINKFKNSDIELSKPNQILTDGDRIYVSDSGNDRICVMTKEGELISTWTNNNKIRFRYPLSMILNNSYLYIGNFYNGDIYIISIYDGTVINTITNDKYMRCSGMYVYKSFLYVNLKELINVYTLDGNFLHKIELSIALIESSYMLILDDIIYIPDPCEDKILLYSIKGKFLLDWSTYDNNKNKFDAPYNIQHINGLLYVNDKKGIYEFDTDRFLIRGWMLGGGLPFSSSFIFLDNKCYVTRYTLNAISIYE